MEDPVTLTLPKTLDNYFAAQNAHDVEGMVTCFAPDAEVRDESRHYSGHDEIREWKRETIAKYGISIEPLDQTNEGGTTTIIGRVTGNFPGSPANLTYGFGLSEEGLIRSLDIH
jgi:hypothetical protein